MCLADKIVQRPADVVIERADRTWTMPNSRTFASRIEGSDARYVMLPNVIEGCRRISNEWPDLLLPSNARLRAPMEHLWIEWRDPASLQEVGVLVEAVENGRAGRMRFFWNGESGTDVAQGEIVFDLDLPLDGLRLDGNALFPFGALPAHLKDLQPHLALAFDECWLAYFQSWPSVPGTLAEAVEQCALMVCADVIDTLAFFTLLGARVPLSERAIDRGKLNKARARSGKPALFDHVELTIGRPAPTSDSGPGQDGLRRNPRLHIVRGHLVRRRDSVFWRAAHMRGLKSTQQAMSTTRRVRLHSGQLGSLCQP